MRRRWKKVLSVSLAVVCALGVAGLFVFLSGRPQGDAPPQGGKKKGGPSIRIEPVREASISRTLELTGEVVPVNSVVIAATVEGPIRYCPWREGDRVAAGEKVIEIDRETYRAEVQAAQAALVVAAAKLEDLKAGTRVEEIAMAEEDVTEWDGMTLRAKSEYDRAERLLERGAVSREDFERSHADWKTAQAKLAAAEAHLAMLKAGATPTALGIQQAMVDEAAAALEVAKARLAECVIAAPFDGTVAAVHVRPGDMAAARTPLVEMIDLSSLVVRFAVPEARATAVRQDMPLAVALDAYPGRTFRAVVSRLYPVLDPTMRTRTVEATFVEPVELVPGMFARLDLQLAKVDSAVVVPSEAVLINPKGQKLLFVIRDGKAEQRRVVTGMEQGRQVQVLEGVSVGEQVVVAGNEKLKDGVSVVLPKSGGGPAGGGPPGKPASAVEKPLAQRGSQG